MPVVAREESVVVVSGEWGSSTIVVEADPARATILPTPRLLHRTKKLATGLRSLAGLTLSPAPGLYEKEEQPFQSAILWNSIIECFENLAKNRNRSRKTQEPAGKIMNPSIEPVDRLTRRAVRLFMDRIADQYDIAGVILFGSRARRTNRPDSDPDLAILLRGEPRRLLPTKLAMADVAFDVLLETGINRSPLHVWMDEWAHPERFANPQLLETIAREGVRL